MNSLHQHLNTLIKNSKGILLALLVLGLPLSVFAQKTQIGTTESFEDNGQPTRFAAYRFDNGDEEFFLELSDADVSGSMTGETGSKYWVFGRLEQGTNTNPLNPQGSIEFVGLDVTGYENIEVRMDLGTLGAGQYDSSPDDFLAIYANIDGGGDILIGNFENNTNELQQDTDLNGTADDGGSDLTSTFQPFTFAVSGTGNSLVLKIVGTNDSGTGAELTTIDNIGVFGNIAESATTPIDGSIAGATTLNTLVIDYPEDVVAGSGGSVTITRNPAGKSKTYDIITNAADFDFSAPNQVTLNLNALGFTFADGEVYEVDITAGVFENAGGSPVQAITGSTDWSFTIDGLGPTGYSVTIDQAFINDANKTALSFSFAGAEVGSTYNYSIDDTNVGTAPITGTAAIATATDQITAIDVTSLDDDNLTLTVYLTDVAGNQGGNVTDNVTKDVVLPVGYSVTIDQAFINAGNLTALSFSFAGAEIGSTYNYSIDDTNVGTAPITGTAAIATATDQITSIDVTSLDDDNLTLTVYLTDVAGNQGGNVTDNVTKDVVLPVGYSVTIDQAFINAANLTALSFTFAGAEIGTTYDYSIDDTNVGTAPITGTAAIATATDQITAIDVTSLDDDNLTLTVYLTDVAGNQGGNMTDNVNKDATAPTGYSVTIDQASINPANLTSLSFTFAGAEVGSTYNYSIDDTNGSTAPITGTAAIATATDQITGIDVTTLDDDNLILTVYLTDAASNQGGDVTDNVTKDIILPTVSPNEFSIISPTMIEFTMSEELGISAGAISGFSIGVSGAITSVIYSDKGTTNLITITDAGAGFIDEVTTVTYTPGGTAIDLVGNEMLSFTETAVVNVVNLGPGDIAFTGYNSEGNPDGFSFVLLKDIVIGTKIKFTDNGWRGTTNKLTNDEITISWTANSYIFAGTEVSIAVNGAGNNFDVSTGTATSDPDITSATVTDDWFLDNAGDQLLAYQGTPINPTFLAGIHVSNDNTEDVTTLWNTVAASNGDNNRSALPTVAELGAGKGLTNGVNAISFSAVTRKENVQYTGTKTGTSPANMALLINNSPSDATAEWDNQRNDNSFTLTSGENYTIPPNLQSTSPANSSLTSASLSEISFTYNPGETMALFSGDINLNLDNGTPQASWNTISDAAQFSIVGNVVTLDISSKITFSAADDSKIYEVDVTDLAFENSFSNRTQAVVGDTDFKFTMDAAPPTVTSINRGTAVPLNASFGTTATTVTYTVLFNELVVPGTVLLGDFATAGTASGGGETIGVSGSGNTYTVTVSGITKLGDLTVNFIGSINDLVGNTGSLGKTGDQSFVIIKPEPAEQPTTLLVAQGADNFTLDLSWIAGAGAQLADGYLILYKTAAGTFPADPTDLIAQANSFNGTNGVANSATNTISIAGLASATQYDFKVYPYTNSTNQIDYKVDGTIITNSGITSAGQESTILLTAVANTISSLVNSEAAAAATNMSFQITDDGALPGIDNAPMLITGITFTPDGINNDINWADAIEGAELNDGTNVWNTDINGGDITIDNTQIAFSNLPTGSGQLGKILDNGIKTYNLRIWLKNPVVGAALQNTIDGLNFVFEVDATSFSYATGSSGVKALQTANSISTRNEATVVATDLNWETQPPTAAGVQAPFTSAPVIEATDANGNRDINYSGAITSVANTGTIVMNNNPDATGLGLSFGSGIYTFDIAVTAFNYQDSGNGTLTITSGTLNASPASNTVTVSYSDNTTIIAGVPTTIPLISSLYTDWSAVAIPDYRFEVIITDDDAGVSVNDNVPTLIDQITFKATNLGGAEQGSNWNDIIANAFLFDGVSIVHTVYSDPFAGAPFGGSITSNSIIFSSVANAVGTVGHIPDGTSKTYKLFIHLKPTITGGLSETMDKKHFNFNIEGADIIVEASSSTMNLVSPAVTSGIGNNEIEVIATKLQYESQPTTSFINEIMLPIIIEATDVNGNRDLDENTTVTLASTGTPAAAGTASLTSGVGNTTNIVHTATGSNLTLTVTDDDVVTPLTQAASNNFDITPGSAESEVIANAFTYETNIPYISHLGANVTAANPKVFQFEIKDGDGTNDADVLNTNVIALGFTITNFNQLESIGLYDNSNTEIAQVASATSINFNLSGTPLIISDDGSSIYHLRATFKTTVTDKTQFRITMNTATSNGAGSTFRNTDGSTIALVAATSSIAGDDNRLNVVAEKFDFTTPPDPTASISSNLTTTPVIQARDANNRMDIDYGASITYSNTDGLEMAHNGGATSGTTLNFTLVGGTHSLPADFQYLEAGNGTLAVTDGSITDGGSSLVTVSASGDSYIRADNTFTYPTNIAYIDFQEANINGDDNGDIEIARFTIVDGNGAINDSDGAGTTLTSITFAVSNPANVRTVALYDGASEVGADQDPTSGTVTFSSLSLTAADNGTKNFTIRISYNSTVTDNEQTQLTIIAASTVGAFGSTFALANASGAFSPLSGDLNRIEVTASKLSFTQQPNDIGVGASFATPLQVTAMDAINNTDTDYSSPVIVTTTGTLSTFTNEPTLFPTAPTSGILTFPTNFNLSAAGTGSIVVNGTTTNPVTTNATSAVFTTTVSNLTTITAGIDSEPLTISSLTNTQPTALQVFDFTFTDDVGAIISNDDKLPTQISQIIITDELGNNEITNWADAIQGAELRKVSNGATVAATAIGATSISFTGLTFSNPADFGYITDDGNESYELLIWLKSSLGGSYANTIDNLKFVFEITDSNITAELGGSTLAATQNVASGPANIAVNVVAINLAYEVQPSTTFINEVMNTVTIEANDGNGNRDLDYSGNATINSSVPAALSSSPVTVSLIGGVGNTTNITHNAVGVGLTLTTTDDLALLNFAGSTLFDITPGSKESDITNAAMAYTQDIAYKDFVTATVTSTDPKVFEFDINDGTSGGGATDSDVLPTNVISLSFNVANPAVLQTIGLFDNNDTKIGQVAAASIITFDLSGSPLVISDLENAGTGVETYHLRATYNTTVVDNTQFLFTVASAIANDQGSSFESLNGVRTAGTVASSSVVGDDNRIEVVATDVVFTSNPDPTNVSTFTNIDSPYIVVEAQDVNFNTDVDYNNTFDAIANNFAPVLTTQNDPTGNFTNGVYDFLVKAPTFQFTSDGLGGRLIISANGLNDGTSSLFDVSASQESYITFVSDGGNIPYITYPPTGDLTDANSYAIAEFMLHDGNPALYGNDIDGASTVISEISISISNSINLDKVGIFDAGGTQYGADQNATGIVTFTGVNFITTDNTTNNFFIKASFKNNTADITDAAVIDIAISNLVGGGGSKFEDVVNNTGGEPDGGGGYITAITPVGNNKIDVVATLFDIVVQPAAVEGINIPIQEPQVKAVDTNGALDLGFNYPVIISSIASMTNVPASFGNINSGTLDFPGFQFAQTGNGTLTVAANGISIISNPVDVIHTSFQNLDLGEGATNDNNGISTQLTLPAGAVNRALLGFSITANQNTTGEPKINEITIRFGNSISGILENIRIFRSSDSDYNTLNNTDLTGSLAITPGSDFINIAGFADEITSSATDRYYFLVVDIGQTANFSSPHLTPQIMASGEAIADVILSSGSVFANIIGREYGFNDINPPIVTARVPIDGSNNFPFSNLIELQFGEKVIPQQSDSLMISIYKYIDDTKIGDYKLDKNATIDSARFFFNTSSNPLEGDTKYYILISPGVESVSGFLDKTGNSFAGYSNKTEWSFTTSDNIDPVFDPDKLPVVTYITDVGFDLKVALDEPGKIFYLVVDPDATTGIPTVDQIRGDVSFLGTLDSGETAIIKGFEYHYVSILNSSDFPTISGNFRVWVTAEDIAAPTPNKMDEGTQMFVDDQFGAPLSQVSVQTTTEEICLGDPQITLSPIYITESTNADFTGIGKTINFLLSDEFSFDVNSTTANIYGQGGDITNVTWKYLNNSVFQIKYSAPTTSSRDKIIISNLAIQANAVNPVGTTGNLIRLGGDGLTMVFPDETLIAEFSTSEIGEISFFTLPSSSTIGNDVPAVALRPDTTNLNILLGIGTPTFTGNGVVGDTLFTSGVALNIPNNIIFEYKDEFGCAVETSKSITIFDANQAIIGLDNIQCTDQAIDVIEINGRAPQFLLTDLQVSIPIDEDPNAFDINDVLSSLIVNGDGDYEFNPGLFNTPSNYALFSGEGGKIGTLLFTGTYQDQQNTTIIETLEQRVDIYIPPVSTITFLDNGSKFETEYCENDGSIRVDGNPKPATGVSVGFFAINNDPNHPALSDNGDGSASIDPFIAGQQGYGFIDVSYSFQNLISSCDSTVTQQIRVNPNPIAGFTNFPGCVLADFNFDNLSRFPNSISSDPNNDPDAGSVIDEWNWDFDDLINSGGSNVSTNEFSTHIFTEADIYDVSLTVTSNRGCESDPFIEPIGIGNNPSTSLSFKQIAVGTPTILTNTTDESNITLDSLAWSINGVFEGGVTSGFSDPYTHIFTTPGQQEVILTAITDKNCAVSAALDMFTVPEYPISSIPYDEDFDGVANSVDKGGWVAWGTNPSWDVGISGGDSIETIPEENPGNVPQNFNFWVTGVDALYNDEEDSYVYSPVFNITNLERPMIQLLKFAHLSSGVVIEYLSEDLSGTSGEGIDHTNWKLLGGLESGAEWYNEGELLIYGGKRQETGQFGWFGSDRESSPDSIELQWKTAKHILDQAKSDASDQNNVRVQFRIAFKSGPDNLGSYNGFAFDNVRIGNRTRTVLLENFTSTQQTVDTQSENNSIQSFSDVNSSLFAVQYHPDLDGIDAIGTTPDADARALYYGIGTTPRVAIDGVADAENPFSVWGAKEYNIRSLDISPLTITTSIDQSNTSKIDISSVIEADISIAKNFIIHTVIIENVVNAPTDANIPSGENSFTNVVRKMLPSASGEKSTVALASGSSVTNNTTWSPTDKYNASEISVLVFVQDELSREIYQADVKTFDTDIVTSLGEELSSNGFAAWPNPANDIITLQVNQRVNKDTKVSIYNQLGKVILRTQIAVGEDKVVIPSQNWTPGIYFILTENNGVPIQKRILIQHR